MAERIWDTFLTAQDRAASSQRPTPSMGFGKAPALLLVDLYNRVFGDRPEPLLESMKRWPASCGLAGWDALPRIKRLLVASRDAQLPIAYSTDIDGTVSGIWPWSKRERAARAASSSSPSSKSAQGATGYYQPDPGFEIVDELRPLLTETVVRKASPSAFFGTPLNAHFNALGVDTIVVCGESTSGCVRATVVDGCTLRYRMIVVEDCVFDRTEAAHAINLFDMNQKYADVVPLSFVVEHIRHLRPEQSVA